MMAKTLRLMTALCALVTLSGAAFAGELAKPDEKVGTPFKKEREVAPLFYVLPDLGTKETAMMEIRILQGKRELVRETVWLPANVRSGAAVDVLFTHPDEIKRLRAIEAQTPGSLRFLSFLAGRLITDEPLADIEARGAKTTMDAAVGQISEVEVKPAPKLRVSANDEDPCWEHCNVQYASCLDWCDPRGDSCTQCEVWYHDCWIECPAPVVPCSEPKKVSNYDVYSVDSAMWYGQWSCVAGQQWDYITIRYLVTTYQRTEHCDGSHTDTWVGSRYEYRDCWANTGYYCYPSNSYFVYPQC
jgi:hypothetical protein